MGYDPPPEDPAIPPDDCNPTWQDYCYCYAHGGAACEDPVDLVTGGDWIGGTGWLDRGAATSPRYCLYALTDIFLFDQGATYCIYACDWAFSGLSDTPVGSEISDMPPCF